MTLQSINRLVRVTDRATLSVAVRDLADEIAYLQLALRPRMLKMWVGGLVLQVVNQPVDVRIEQ